MNKTTNTNTEKTTETPVQEAAREYLEENPATRGGIVRDRLLDAFAKALLDGSIPSGQGSD